MSEFIAQSEPVAPPSMPQITEPKQKLDPQLFMDNERNTYQTILAASIVLGLGVYLPLVMPSDTMRWVGVLLCIAAMFILFTGLYTFKRNLDSFNRNEQNFIDWNTSTMMIYSIGSIMSIVSAMVVYEMYWNATPKSPTPPSVPDDVKSVGSVKSSGSVKSLGSMGSRGSQ